MQKLFDPAAAAALTIALNNRGQPIWKLVTIYTID